MENNNNSMDNDNDKPYYRFFILKQGFKQRFQFYIWYSFSTTF